MGWECSSSSSSDATPGCCSSSGGDSMATALGFPEQQQCQWLWKRSSRSTHLQRHGKCWAALEAAAMPGSCMTMAWAWMTGVQLLDRCSRCCQPVPRSPC